MLRPQRFYKRAHRVNVRACFVVFLCFLGTSGRIGAAQKTIVILGSSTAQGVGASTYARSWAGLLTSAVAPRGWTVQNVSISGSGTAGSLARFDQDVTPLRPGL